MTITFANLNTIDLEKLVAKDSETQGDLLHAAESVGFFYVDLRGSRCSNMIEDVETLFSLSYAYFAQPGDVKANDSHEDSERGYKSGKGYESLEISLMELRDKGSNLPTNMTAAGEKLSQFAERSDWLAKLLLDSLLTDIGQKGLMEIVSSPGDSGLKFISAPTSIRQEEAPDTTHTDGGVITLLWCPQTSSQIRDRDAGEWWWIEPKEGHALVNVADVLQQQTGGRLHSCVHRVLQPSDGARERHFLSYYLRPGTV